LNQDNLESNIDKKTRRIVGFVEEAGGKGKKAFANFDELWDILISSKSLAQKGKSGSPVRRDGKKERR